MRLVEVSYDIMQPVWSGPIGHVTKFQQRIAMLNDVIISSAGASKSKIKNVKIQWTTQDGISTIGKRTYW